MIGFEATRRIAATLLYEGYALFPYAATSLKNRVRASFGELAPRGHIARSMQSSEVMLDRNKGARIFARVAFLQPIQRVVKTVDGVEVGSLDTGDRRFVTWQEAREIVVELGPWAIEEVRATYAIDAEALDEVAPIVDRNGERLGSLERRALRIACELRLERRVVGEVVIVHCELENVTRTTVPSELESMHAAHVALRAEGASFLSAIDPPVGFEATSEACESDGAWPILVGKAPDRSSVLLSPIILYDYPEVATESPDDLFDMTENDELLTLSILSLTEEERRAMVATDPRCAALLARIDEAQDDRLSRLHGAIRALHSGPRVRVGETFVGVGDSVLLHPSGRDGLDTVIAGARATVVDIMVDVQGREQAVVVLDDDPGRDFGVAGLGVGHRLFLDVREIEPVPAVRQ